MACKNATFPTRIFSQPSRRRHDVWVTRQTGSSRKKHLCCGLYCEHTKAAAANKTSPSVFSPTTSLVARTRDSDAGYRDLHEGEHQVCFFVS